MNAAQTILAQLGGNKFIAMTGAKDMVRDASALQFRIGKGAINKANTVRVELQPDDSYTVKFYSVRGLNVREVSRHEYIHAETLRPLFSHHTGMATSL